MSRRRVDGKKVGIDWERARKSLSGHHRTDEMLNSNIMNVAQIQLQRAIAEGRLSSARKLRVAINQALEARLAIRASWCPTCISYLSDCTCPKAPTRFEGASIELIDRIQARLAEENADRRAEFKAYRKRKRIEARKQRKLGVAQNVA
jgi:hypothetical protein